MYNTNYSQQTYIKTSGVCKIAVIIMSIISAVMCNMPWVIFDYWINDKEMTIFELTEHYIQLADFYGEFDIIALFLMVASAGIGLSIIGYVLCVFIVAFESSSSNTFVKLTNTAALIGSILANVSIIYLAEGKYSMLESKVISFIFLIFSVIQLILSKELHYGEVNYNMRAMYNWQSLSNEQLKAQGKWRCCFCGKINANYVGRCACGHTREETVREENRNIMN